MLEAVQKRLDESPQAMRQRRETVEHPFGTLKACMGTTHFLTKRIPKVATEMALQVLAYNLTRVLNIVGVKPLIAAMRAQDVLNSGNCAISQPLRSSGDAPNLPRNGCIAEYPSQQLWPTRSLAHFYAAKTRNGPFYVGHWATPAAHGPL